MDALFPIMDQIDEQIDEIETQVYSAATETIGRQKPLDLVPCPPFQEAASAAAPDNRPTS